jgi:hypothetical protein
MTPHPSARVPSSPRAALRRAAFALTAAGLLALTAGGCEQRDENARLVQQASDKLDLLGAGGAIPTPDVDKARKEFKDVITTLRPVAGDAGPSSGPAGALVARAQAGLGDLKAAEAAAAEHAFVAQLMGVRAGLDRWFGMSSMAAALEGYDPAKDIAALETQIGERTAEMQSLKGDKARQEQTVAAIRQKAEAARAQARQERDRETALRGRAEGGTQVARADLIAQAVQASRAADALERQALEQDALANKEAPRVAEIDNQVGRLTRQVELLRTAQAEARARAEANKKQADEARAEAAKAAQHLTDATKALAAARAAVDEPSDEAHKQFQAAISTMKKAAGAGVARETKAAAQSALGSFSQSDGDVLSTRARVLAAYAGALRAVADAKPAVPNAGDVAAQADKAAKEMEETRTAAREAYAAAEAAYKNAGASPAVKVKMERLTAALGALAGLKAEAPPPSDKPADKPAESRPAADADAPKPAGATDTRPALSAEVTQRIEGEVRAAATTLAKAMAAHDAAGVAAAFDLPGEAQSKSLQAMLPVAFALDDLNKAARDKFGKDLPALLKDTQEPTVKNNPAMAGVAMMGPAFASLSLPEEAIASAAVTVESETKASIAPQGTDHPASLVKKGDGWKVVAPPMPPTMGADNPQAAAMMSAMTSAFSGVAGDTAAGKYPAADDMLKDLSARLMQAMMGGGGAGGSGGARPGRSSGPRPSPAPAGGGRPAPGTGSAPGSGG